MLFSYYSEFEKKLKIWKSNVAAASDVIMLLWLPWQPIKQQVVSMKLKAQRTLIICAKYLVNRMNGVKSRGEGSDWPPPALCLCVTFFTLCLLGLK